MTDVTSLVIEAQDARSRMQEAKRRVKAEVRRKYEAQMTRDIAEGTLNAEVEFARTLARIHAAGVPQAVLRREVLRTNVWSTWTYWRDMAGIEPDRVTVANARAQREAANSPFQWSDDYSILTVTKNPAGEGINPVTFFLDTLTKDGKGRWTANTSRDGLGISLEEREVVEAGNVREWREMIDAAIQDQIEKGNVSA